MLFLLHAAVPTVQSACPIPDAVVDALLRRDAAQAAVRAAIDSPQADCTCPDEPLLPLHLALLRGASLRVVRALLAAHPGGARTKLSDGSCALHLAAARCAADVTRAVYDADPSMETARDKRGRRPREVLLDKWTFDALLGFVG